MPLSSIGLGRRGEWRGFCGFVSETPSLTSLTHSKNTGVRIMSRLRGRGSGTSITVTILPGRGLITCTWSDINTASAIECVTSRAVMPNLARAQQFNVHPLSCDFVESAERFVEQQDIGCQDQRARNRHPLLHASGQFVW